MVPGIGCHGRSTAYECRLDCGSLYVGKLVDVASNLNRERAQRGILLGCWRGQRVDGVEQRQSRIAADVLIKAQDFRRPDVLDHILMG